MMNTRDQGRPWLAPDHPSLTYTAHVHIDRDATLRERRRHSGFATSTTPAFARAPFGCSPSMPGTKPKTSPRTSSGGSRKKSMVNTNRDIGQEILDGILELKRGETGRVTEIPSVADIRETTGLSQARFAQLLGVSARTLQEWEQGRRAPSGAARTLLLMARRNPKALLDAARDSTGHTSRSPHGVTRSNVGK